MGKANRRVSVGDSPTTRWIAREAGLAAAILTAVALISAVACEVASAAVCANETLRSSLGSTLLPDCRAYEMVTPPFKDGYPLQLRSFASDGEKVILASFGAFANPPGSGGGVEDNFYLDSRSADGWRLSSIMEPLSRFLGQAMVASEANDGMSLWEERTPQQGLNMDELYVRSASGEYTRVGTLSPNAEESATVPRGQFLDELQAATSAYQHIVLSAGFPGKDYWNFDKTLGGHSLYEYSGTNKERPVLVAAKGAKAGKGEEEELIAVCGAELGSGIGGSMYNALSSDGETIFFTLASCTPGPHTDEIYARLHGATTSAEAAESIDIGESECTEECGSEESARNFEGASEGGSKVFFTSTQKLTNNAGDLTAGGSATEEGKPGCAQIENAGGCNLYEYNFALKMGRRLTLVAGGAEQVRGVAGIAEGGSRIYYVAEGEVPGSGENEFHRLPVGGAPDLYVYNTDTGVTSFIATLNQADQEDWQRRFRRPVEITGEGGRFLFFASAEPGLTPDESSKPGVVQLFEYDAETGELVRVTQGERVGKEGWNDNGNDVTVGANPVSIGNVARELGEVGDFKVTANRLNIASDGKTVVFETIGELSPFAAPASELGCSSVYEFRSNGPISAGTVHMLSDGRDVPIHKGAGEPCGAEFIGSDETGNNILLATSDPLLSSDVDGGQRNIYDARVNGGFSLAPMEGEVRACAAGTCEGPTTPVGRGVIMAPAAGAEGDLTPAGTSGAATGSMSKGTGEGSKSPAKKARGRKICKNRDKMTRQRGLCRGPSHGRRTTSRVHGKQSAGKDLR